MSLYQCKILATDTNVGNPAPLPADLVGLSDASLADLSASIPDAAVQLGYAGEGFFPYTPPPPPPPPPSPPTYTRLEFLFLFTPEEVIAIQAAALINDPVAYYNYMINAVVTLQLTDQAVIDGVNMLVVQGVLTADRAAQILAGDPAPVTP